MAEYDADGWQQVIEDEPDRTAEDADSAAPDGTPEPWYRNRVLLALWALMVALLLTLVIYGIVELSRGGGETGGPATTSTTPTRTSTTTPSNTTSPSTTMPSSTSEAPPPESPEQTPEEAPPPANNSPSPAPPTRHHHHLHVPHFF
jgi:hypothetical protein